MATRRRTGGAGAGDGGSRVERELRRAQDAARRRAREPFELRASWGRGRQLEYIYKGGDLLVDDGDLDRVVAKLREWGIEPDVADPLIAGVTLLRVDGDAESIVERCDRTFGSGVVTLNHVLDVQGFQGGLCPASEPEPATAADRWPAVPDPRLGAGVRVAVVDTGFLPGYEKDKALPWLAGVDRFDPDDEAYLKTGQQRIAPYGGHGTFSAGVVLSVAPGVRASVDDVLVGGVVDEATIVRQLVQALEDSPDIICLSAGTYTRKNLPPKAFTAFYEHRLRHHKGVAVIAAAGNNGDRQPFWPAAFPWALAVGALSRDGERRMPWSNTGGWVDVYAPGEGVVNAFPTGSYTDLEGRRRQFRAPMARWSGTSFATPIVAGLVARRMSQRGEHGVEAAKALRRIAQQQHLPGVGARLLP